MNAHDIKTFNQVQANLTAKGYSVKAANDIATKIFQVILMSRQNGAPIQGYESAMDMLEYALN